MHACVLAAIVDVYFCKFLRFAPSLAIRKREPGAEIGEIHAWGARPGASGVHVGEGGPTCTRVYGRRGDWESATSDSVHLCARMCMHAKEQAHEAGSGREGDVGCLCGRATGSFHRHCRVHPEASHSASGGFPGHSGRCASLPSPPFSLVIAIERCPPRLGVPASCLIGHCHYQGVVLKSSSTIWVHVVLKSSSTIRLGSLAEASPDLAHFCKEERGPKRRYP